MPRHKLSEKNLEKMTAVCSVDGNVALHRNGDKVRCAVASRNARQSWVRRNPDRAAAGRRTRSTHKLTSVDGSTGTCPVCGPVAVVPQGRGWMCATRAAELGMGHQSTPQQRCGRCVKFFLNADGTCRYCDDETALDLGKAFKAGEDLGNLRAAVAGRSELTTTVDISRPQVSLLADDSRVDGWRVIGAGIPEGVNPRHFVNDWWASHPELAEDT